jgi:hypothetical protein
MSQPSARYAVKESRWSNPVHAKILANREGFKQVREEESEEQCRF